MGMLFDSRKSIEVYDAFCADISEKIAQAEEGSDEYEKLEEQLRKMIENKNLEVGSYMSIKNGLIPQFGVSFATALLATWFGMKIYKGEATGVVIGSTASNLFKQIRW